jgi:hypothetical protein
MMIESLLQIEDMPLGIRSSIIEKTDGNIKDFSVSLLEVQVFPFGPVDDIFIHFYHAGEAC